MYCKQYNEMIKTIYQTNPGVITNVYVNMMNVYVNMMKF